MTINKTIVGWREWIGLPGLGIPAVIAKIDTGARSSALHVDEHWQLTQSGAPWIGFKIHNLLDSDAVLEGMAPIADRRPVTDSGGHRTERIFIDTVLRIGGVERLIQLNLVSRGAMRYPLLIGRTAIRTRFVVDANKSFVHGGDRHQPPGNPA